MQRNSGARICVGARRAVPKARWDILVVPVFVLICLWAWVAPAQAQEGPLRHHWVIWPSGTAAFPTGRFAETIKNTKDGNKTGLGGALDLGYVLTERVAAGISFDYTRFPLDFAIPLDQTGQTTAISGQVWGRYFLPGGFARWRPYLLAGIGVGRPKVRIDFPVPVRMEDTLLVKHLEYTVSTRLSMTGGIGFWIPVAGRVALSLEPRYCSISSKAANLTEKKYTVDGRTPKKTYKDKSNTNWWEIRGGLVITFP